MKKTTLFIVALLCILSSKAADYTTYLTTERGFTEVTSTAGLLTGDYYYVIGSAEDTNFFLAPGAYADKPGWAYTAVSLRYKVASESMLMDDRNFFTIEALDSYIGFRNLFYSHSLFQTNDGQPWIYCNAFLYETEMSIWDALTPTFQNGYWKFESGQFPGNFLGPWSMLVADNEPIAGNRTDAVGDEAGHFRLFRISKNDYNTTLKNARLAIMSTASPNAPVDATWMIKNPSFEQGKNDWYVYRDNPVVDIPFENVVWQNDAWQSNESGITDDNGNTVNPQDWGDTRVADYNGTYAMTDGDGGYVYNSYCWWAPTLYIHQTVTGLPAGLYELSAVMSTFPGRNLTLKGNDVSTILMHTGTDEHVGTTISLTTTITDGTLSITAQGNTDWWSGASYQDPAIGFVKADNFQLKYIGQSPIPLPNDETTILEANKWYYYEAPASGKYYLTGNLQGLVYSETYTAGIQAARTKNEMGFTAGRVYFMTQRSDATLKVEPANTVETFTAVALNVDGLPKKIATVELNPDGREGEGASLMSTYIYNKGYDVIALSEDFNFHSELTSNLNNQYNIGTHRAKITYTAAITAANTDGLGLLVKKDANFSNESWTKFNSSANSWDGSKGVKKGYRYYTVTLADGNVIDLFIAHLDAGDDGVNYRPGQLQQIANAILDNGNPDRPKIFMGDTNCRWTREDIKTNFMDILTSTYDVGDAWVELAHDNIYPTPGTGTINGEVVDKVFYINPKGNNKMKLTPISYRRETDFVDSNGVALGDHAPVVVNFGIGLYEEVDNTVTPGDIVNHDGQNTTDLEALVNILMGNANSSYDMNAADVNGDGDITLADITALVNMLRQ